MDHSFRLFGLNATKGFAKDVADHLDIGLSKHTEYYFSDREPYIKSDVNVRNCDVYIIQSLYDNDEESVCEKFMKLLFFIGSLRDASARRITAVIPYLSYARQDRKTESRAPITTRYVAQFLESAGADRLLTMDVHNLSAFQNSFRIPVDNLEAKNLLVNYIIDDVENPESICFLATDSGGMGRTKRCRDALQKKLNIEVGLAYLDKTHAGKNIKGHDIIGDISGKLVIAIDDMISSGKTLSECSKAIAIKNKDLEDPAEFWGACATHGLFVGKVNEHLINLDRIVVTDTISHLHCLDKDVQQKTVAISTTKIFAQAIRRTHEEGGSLSDLLK